MMAVVFRRHSSCGPINNSVPPLVNGELALLVSSKVGSCSRVSETHNETLLFFTETISLLSKEKFRLPIRGEVTSVFADTFALTELLVALSTFGDFNSVVVGGTLLTGLLYFEFEFGEAEIWFSFSLNEIDVKASL